MERKQVLFIADSLDNAHKFQHVLAGLGVDVAAGSSLQFDRLLSTKNECDLVVYEVRSNAVTELAAAEELILEHGGGVALLAIVRQADLEYVQLPMHVKSDFVVADASEKECIQRIRLLLWAQTSNSSSECIVVDAMSINLATYQVQVAGEPIDLTYLEYALLAFLVTHSGRTYSRDTLLRNVWGFDYYGGSRTVDVHVRRIRAKLGPELAQHLETIRGVGYLWNM